MRRGFTLVELSIVLVILGLLVGGVLSGRALIRSAQLRAITTEKDRFTTAIFTFRDKYFALPGDMPNAYAFWGTTCGTNTTTPVTGCNGNGNGFIEDSGAGEDIEAWEHLSRSGLIEGSYDGTGAILGGVGASPTETNVPKSKFSTGAWDLSHKLGYTTSTFYNDMLSNVVGGGDIEGHLFLHFGSVAGSDQLLTNESLTRAEAWSIDTKIDDGKTNTGKVRGHASAECYDLGTDYYDLQGSTGVGDANTADCLMHFLVM